MPLRSLHSISSLGRQMCFLVASESKTNTRHFLKPLFSSWKFFPIKRNHTVETNCNSSLWCSSTRCKRRWIGSWYETGKKLWSFWLSHVAMKKSRVWPKLCTADLMIYSELRSSPSNQCWSLIGGEESISFFHLIDSVGHLLPYLQFRSLLFSLQLSQMIYTIT